MNFKAVYINIKNNLKKKKISYQDMADILGISRSSMCRKMAGITQWQKDEIDIMCKYFNKSYENLFKEE